MSLNISENTLSAIQKNLLITGAWLLIAGIFSIPLLGNGAHNLLLGLPIIILLFTKNIYQYIPLLKSNSTALFSTLLFSWMVVSISWSVADSDYSFKILSKYREFLLIPLFMIFFSIEKYRHNAFISLYTALLLSLIFSYLIHYDVVNFWDNQHSIKNRIFHGISMSFFAYMSLQAAVIFKKQRLIFAVLFLITIHNLFFIENGRTGYILISVLTALFCWQQFKLKGLLILFCIAGLAGTAVIYIVDTSHLRILDNFNTININTENILFSLQETDIRSEYYIISALAFFDSWLLGHGMGNFPDAYLFQHEIMPTFWGTTVNSHNEFLQISVQTGIIGLALFISFLFSLILSKKGIPLLQHQFKTALFFTFIISCMFNSSFMDHGDGTLFMILTALIAGTSWASNNNSNSNQSILQ